VPITRLIDKRDTFEIVRDELAAILKTESASQALLATAASRDPRDWMLRVYLERTNPWSDFLDLPETEEHPWFAPPIVNVWFDSTSFDGRASNVVERQKATAAYNVDCYGYAVSADDASGGHQAGDERAGIECQRAVRLVRNILMAGEYTYLGLRGVVWRRFIPSITAFQPSADGRPVQQVQAARLRVEVEFSEFSPQVEGEPLELVSTTVRRAETGEIFLTAMFGGEV
jgi:hypothetical protein